LLPLYIQKRKETYIMTTLDLEADKARLAHAILAINNASVLADVKKYLSRKLKLTNTITTQSSSKKARPISREVQDLVIGELPADMDVKKETDKMWEELAQ
jgi:hypothetical protein